MFNFRSNHVNKLFPANESTSNQNWKKVDCQHSSTLLQRWYLVENESWANIYLATLFQHWIEVIFSTLKYGYHNLTSIVSYHQTCLWWKPKFNVVSTLASTFNQCWQYDVNSTLISRRLMSRLYFNIHQCWKNVEYLLGCCC